MTEKYLIELLREGQMNDAEFRTVVSILYKLSTVSRITTRERKPND